MGVCTGRAASGGCLASSFASLKATKGMRCSCLSLGEGRNWTVRGRVAPFAALCPGREGTAAVWWRLVTAMEARGFLGCIGVRGELSK